MKQTDTDRQPGTDAWSREARRIRALAARLGLTLDEEEIAFKDVRDLQALRASLQSACSTRRDGLVGAALDARAARTRSTTAASAPS